MGLRRAVRGFVRRSLRQLETAMSRSGDAQRHDDDDEGGGAAVAGGRQAGVDAAAFVAVRCVRGDWPLPTPRLSRKRLNATVAGVLVLAANSGGGGGSLAGALDFVDPRPQAVADRVVRGDGARVQWPLVPGQACMYPAFIHPTVVLRGGDDAIKSVGTGDDEQALASIGATVCGDDARAPAVLIMFFARSA